MIIQVRRLKVGPSFIIHKIVKDKIATDRKLHDALKKIRAQRMHYLLLIVKQCTLASVRIKVCLLLLFDLYCGNREPFYVWESASWFKSTYNS